MSWNRSVPLVVCVFTVALAFAGASFARADAIVSVNCTDQDKVTVTNTATSARNVYVAVAYRCVNGSGSDDKVRYYDLRDRDGSLGAGQSKSYPFKCPNGNPDPWDCFHFEQFPTPGCNDPNDDFIVSARAALISSTGTVTYGTGSCSQLSGVYSISSANLDVPSDLVLTTAVNPQGGPGTEACYTFADTTNSQVVNLSYSNSYRGILAGKTICPTANSSNPQNSICSSQPLGRGIRGKYRGVELGPESCENEFVFFADPSNYDQHNFPFCCDPILAVQCATYVITDVQDPNGFHPLDPPIWFSSGLSSHRIDMEPPDNDDALSLYSTSNPLLFGCLDFAYSDMTFSTEVFHEAVNDFAVPGPHACFSSQEDSDADGVPAACDLLVPSMGPASGETILNVTNHIRNDNFTGAFTSGVTGTIVCSGETSNLSTESSTPDLASFSDPNVTVGTCTVRVDPDGTGTQHASQVVPAGQKFVAQTRAYVADSAPASLAVLDVTGAGQRYLIDSDPNDLDNTHLHLDAVSGIGSPLAMGLRKVDGFHRELYFLSTVGGEPRVFGVSTGSHAKLSPETGRLMPSGAQAQSLAITPDQQDLYVPFISGSNQMKIEVFDLTQGTSTGTSSQAVAGLPRDIVVHDTGSQIVAFVTQEYCIDNQGELWLLAYDMTQLPGGIISRIPISGGYHSCSADPMLESGLAKNGANTRLYIADRDGNSVVIWDTVNNAYAGAIGLSPQTRPVDVAVGLVALGVDEERVFVANQGADTISVIDAAAGTIEFTISLDTLYGAADYKPASLELTSDGTQLIVTNRGNNSVVILNPATGAKISPRPILVGGAATRIAVQEVLAGELF